MLGEIFGFLRDVIQFIWPFKIIKEWERGGVYELGHFIRVVGPGCWPIIPWFTEIIEVPVVPKPIATGRQDITLKSGSTLSFDAAATLRVADVEKALNAIDDYHHSASVLLSSILAEKLADVEPDRFEPSKRGRLFSSLETWVQKECGVYGIEITNLRFTSFVLNARTLRLLIDKTDSTPVF
jgi:regulator of protease activity HflC (stomatin/prohibitin superfamily)